MSAPSRASRILRIRLTCAGCSFAPIAALKKPASSIAADIPYRCWNNGIACQHAMGKGEGAPAIELDGSTPGRAVTALMEEYEATYIQPRRPRELRIGDWGRHRRCRCSLQPALANALSRAPIGPRSINCVTVSRASGPTSQWTK